MSYNTYQWTMPIIKGIADFFTLGQASKTIQQIADSIEGMTYDEAVSEINALYRKAVSRLTNDEQKLSQLNERLSKLRELSYVPGLREKVRTAITTAASKARQSAANLDLERTMIENEYNTARDRLMNESDSKKRIIANYKEKVK